MEYQCEGFLEKNKDTVYEEQIKVLKSSKVTMYMVFFNQDIFNKMLIKHYLLNDNNDFSNKVSFIVSFLLIRCTTLTVC